MRDILFHGRRMDNGNWIVGSLTIDDFVMPSGFRRKTCIKEIPVQIGGKYSWAEVDPNTVGQYIGRNTQHGSPIFDGDLVRVRVTPSIWNFTNAYTDIFEVAYHPKYCFFYLKNAHNNLLLDGNQHYTIELLDITGSIHDGPWPPKWIPEPFSERDVIGI